MVNRVSQVLTLFTTPVIYLWFDRVQQRYFNFRGVNEQEEGNPAE